MDCQDRLVVGRPVVTWVVLVVGCSVTGIVVGGLGGLAVGWSLGVAGACCVNAASVRHLQRQAHRERAAVAEPVARGVDGAAVQLHELT